MYKRFALEVLQERGEQTIGVYHLVFGLRTIKGLTQFREKLFKTSHRTEMSLYLPLPFVRLGILGKF